MNHDKRHIRKPWNPRSEGWTFYMNYCGVVVYPDDTTSPDAPECDWCRTQADRSRNAR